MSVFSFLYFVECLFPLASMYETTPLHVLTTLYQIILNLPKQMQSNAPIHLVVCI